MADSADLLVLGAYYGTGNKGGLMSVFLMGCYDEDTKTYRYVSRLVMNSTDVCLELFVKLETDSMMQ